MSKKHHAKKPGWPVGHEAAAPRGQHEAIRRIARRLATQSVPDEEFARYMDRLGKMLRDWREFRLIRPDMLVLQRALRSLPEDEFHALLDPAKGQRRSRRARAHLFQQVFDAELAEQFLPALTEAVERAGSPDDAGALALAMHSLRAWANNSVAPEANPLLVVLLEVAFDDFHELGRAIKEVEAAEKPSEGEAPADDPDRQKRIQEAIAKHPAFQVDAERRAFRLGSRLLRYVERGVVRAHLTAEELSPLTALLRQALAHVAPSPPDLLAAMQAFLADPANDPAFRRFTEELAAEAAEATEKALPQAEHLQGLAAFCQAAMQPGSPVRAIVAQASLARLRPELEAAATGAEAANPKTG